MKFVAGLSGLFSLVTLCTSTILQNGQVRETNFPNTKIASITSNSTGWKTYGANATELSYKGRWDSKHISWWAYVPTILQLLALMHFAHFSPLELLASNLVSKAKMLLLPLANTPPKAFSLHTGLLVLTGSSLTSPREQLTTSCLQAHLV
jgi:hypothetical protein